MRVVCSVQAGRSSHLCQILQGFGREPQVLIFGDWQSGEPVLMVVHTDREDVTRLISARKATAKERRRYEKAILESFDH